MGKKVLALAAALLFIVVGAAHAAPYPPAANGLSASSPVQQGGSITATAQVFQAGASVTFTLEGKGGFTGVATADANGVATFTGTVPANAKTGNHTLRAKGTGADGRSLTLTTQVNVVSGATVLGETITRPGSGDSATPFNAGSTSDGFPATNVGLAALTGVGLLALLGNRYRKRKTAVPALADV